LGALLWFRTSADLFKTAFDLLVSVTLFLGRFDMRTMQVLYLTSVLPMGLYNVEWQLGYRGLSDLEVWWDQAAMTQAQQHGNQDGILYDHLSKCKELWFDFMADTGDGGNSTYSVARLLAQPSLTVGDLKLPRGHLLIVGGDLA
jgi:hypothetical protein